MFHGAKSSMNEGNISHKTRDQVLKVTKLALLFLIVSLWEATAALSYSQVTKLNLEMNGTILQVLNSIENQSEFTFVYKLNEVNLDEKVSVDLKNKSIDEVLEVLLRNKSLGYKITDRHIVLFKKEEVKQQSQPTTIVTGTIVDDFGEPVIGANVLVKDQAGIVTTTDMNGKFSLDLVKACVEKAGAQIITLALRRANEGGLANILDYIPKDVTLLPNTSGARTAEEALRIAKLSRELGCGDFVKVEVIHDSKYLLPDNYETVRATEMLAKEGFIVMPYMYPDLNVARDLVNAGAACVMPLGSPIGSNKGICTREFIQILIDEIDLPIIVDAGIGRPSQACEAMEMGASAVMANTAIATAGNVEVMAEAFKKAIEAGRSAYLSGLGRTLEKGASASSPLTGFLRD